MAYNLDFYAESRQHAIAYLATQGLGPEIETMLATAIGNMAHDGPLHVVATGSLGESPGAVVTSLGSYLVTPINFVDVAPAVIANEAPAVGWKAWLEGKRHVADAPAAASPPIAADARMPRRSPGLAPRATEAPAPVVEAPVTVVNPAP